MSGFCLASGVELGYLLKLGLEIARLPQVGSVVAPVE